MIVSPPAPESVLSLSDAYQHCLSLCRAHYENFPVASWWIPQRLRGPVAAVYAFARTADDFADESTFKVELTNRYCIERFD
jgi:phytoene/squalene synthetase